MSQYILALDQGTTSSRAIVFDRARQSMRRRAEGVPANLPEAGLGGARRRGDLVVADRRGERSHRAARYRHERHRRDRHHQSARDHRRVGPQNGPAHSSTPSSGRTAAPRDFCDELKQQRPGAHLPAKDRAPARSPTFPAPSSAGSSITCPARATRRSAASSPSAPSIPGSSGTSPAASATPPTSPTPRARCSSISTSAAGTMSCSPCSRSRKRCCPKCARRRRFTATPPPGSSRRASPSPASPATSKPPRSARRRCSAAWRRTPTAPAASCC